MQAALACSQVHRNAPLHDLYTPGHAVPPVAQCLPTRCLYVLPFDSIIEAAYGLVVCSDCALTPPYAVTMWACCILGC